MHGEKEVSIAMLDRVLNDKPNNNNVQRPDNV